MATTTTVTTSYNGQYAGEIISKALLSATTIENGLIEVKPNVKYKSILKRLSTGNLLSGENCDFTATSNVDLDERELEVKHLQVNLQLCKADFQDDYLALEQGDSAHNNLPSSFAEYLIAHVSAKVAEELEGAIWNGDGSADTFEGFLPKFDADASIITVDSTAITAANVQDELGKVVDSIPQEIYTKEDLFIFVAPNVARAYVRALGGQVATSINGYDNKSTMWYNGGTLSFDGVKIVVANGLPSGEMVAAQKSNLYFGTSLMADWQEVKVLDMADIDGSKNVRMVMRFAAGVQYAFGAEIVYYRPSVA